MVQKRQMEQMRRQYIEDKGYTVVEIRKSEWWKLNKTDVLVKEHLRENFPYKRPLRQDQLLDKKKLGAKIGYLQSDTKVP